MLINRIVGFTRELGRSQGYVPLPIRDDFITDEGTNAKMHVMVTSWQPQPEELEKLIQGASVLVTILGPERTTDISDEQCIAESRHPPLRVIVGPVPGE